jgi:NADH dehydrogenase
VPYDYLIVAAGARHSYFGHDAWETAAPGLKTVEDALEMRRRILLAFELAEREAYLDHTMKPLTFVVVGGGPTGVELAGAIGDIARMALKNDFKAIDTTKARVILFEGADRILGAFPPELSASGKRQLESIGVEVRLNSFVTDIEPGRVKVGEEWINCDVVLWATGVAASSLGSKLGAETDKAGRVFVNPDLSLPNSPNVFVIGDMASLKQENGEPVPGLGAAAQQEGTRAAKNILSDIANKSRANFRYWDKGTMATIGRSKAIVDLRGLKVSGFIAWLIWLFLHVLLLIGFRNRLAVLVDWAWAYLTRERSARLITGDAEELRNALEFLQARPDTSIAEVVSKPKASAAK